MPVSQATRREALALARSDWILPRADSACGRAFHPNRQSAEGHRIALEFWMHATGSVRAGYRLATFRCKRCGGFHIGRKKVDPQILARPLPNPSGFEASEIQRNSV